MRVTLEPHPSSQAPAIRIEAEAERSGANRLVLRYAVTGDVESLLLPPPAPPGPADGLWQHCCFEAFVRTHGEAGYYEFNFAPSGKWAVYRFSDYRAGMEPIDEVPEIETRLDSAGYSLAASIDLEEELGLLDALPWQLGLTAVIETRDGGRSFWAMTHPSGAPDFHHRDCFALELPPPERP